MIDWTPERIDRLKQLWADGYSASEIARTLGGTTRNAVIGKRSRLGLEARSVAGGRPLTRHIWGDELKRLVAEGRSRAEMMVHFGVSESGLRRRLEAVGLTARRSYRRASSTPALRPPQPRKQRRPKEPPTPPESKMIPLMDLEPESCRWPIGDPKDADFAFCGAKSKVGSPYCDHHDHIAYVEPEPAKSRSRPVYVIKRAA